MNVNPGRTRYRVRFPRGFVGFSTEYRLAPAFFGDATTGPNPVALEIYREFARARSGPPALRLGGGSTDEVWWNPSLRRPRPLGIYFDITQPFLTGLRNFARSSGAPLYLGLDLANPLVSTARDWMLAANRALGRRVRAYELGNEPDIYGRRFYYVDSRGRQRTARPSSYSFGNYLFDFRRRAVALRRALPRAPLAGPAAVGYPAFTEQGVVPFLRRERKRVKLLTYHEYFGDNCSGTKPGSYGYATRRKLLSARLMNSKVTKYAGLVTQARRYRRGVRITETNSVACGGKPGVSNSFASALWGADWMLRMLAVGVRGMDLHTFGLYSPFGFTWTPAEGWRGIANPLYYGMLFFSRATASRATLLLDASFTAKVRRGANVVGFATVDRRGTVRVGVINKDGRRGGRVRVKIARARGRTSLIRLRAPSVASTSGVTLAGQSMPYGSPDGRLTGPKRVERPRRRGGVYTFTVPKASAALLEVRRR